MRDAHDKETRAIVVYNPLKIESNDRNRAKRGVDYLRKLGRLQIVDQVATTQYAATTKDKILESLGRRRRPLVIAIGGDGTINTVTEALMSQAPEQRSRLLTIAAGTYNDFHYGHNRRVPEVATVNPFIAFKRPPEMVYPMRLQVQPPEAKQPTTHYANNIFGFHFTAAIARRAGQPENRESRIRSIPLIGGLLGDIRMVTSAVPDLSTFQSRDSIDGDQNLLTRSFIHSSYVGRYGHFPDISHGEPSGFIDLQTACPTITSAVGTAALAMAGRAGGDHRRRVSFQNGPQKLLAHKDGELFVIPAGAQVETHVAPDGIEVYGTASRT